jgi:hypothetical protein
MASGDSEAFAPSQTTAFFGTMYGSENVRARIGEMHVRALLYQMEIFGSSMGG